MDSATALLPRRISPPSTFPPSGPPPRLRFRCHSAAASSSSLGQNPSLLLSVVGGRRASVAPKVGSRCVVRCGVREISESEFSETVLKSDRPVLVEFVADWCGPCRLVAPAVEAVAQEYGDRLTVAKIDHDANPKLIEEYKVYGLPALILFKDGKEVPESRREGAITKAKLKEYVESLLNSPSVV